MKIVLVTIYARVFDEKVLIKAARVKYIEDQHFVGSKRVMLTPKRELELPAEATEVISSAGTALQWFLDPDMSPPGCEIEESVVSEVGSAP